MKNILFATSAALLLFGAVSCTQEDINNPSQGDGNVTFTVELPGDMGTRAFGDGYTAKNLEMAVYNASGDLVYEPEAVTFDEGSLTKEVKLDLAQGVEYKIAFFAHSKADGGYTFSAANKTITANYAAMATKYNTDAFDCFYALFSTGKITKPFIGNVKLNRPVAQINWGTSDLKAAAVVAESAYGKDANNEAKNLYTQISTVAGNTLNVLTGEVSGEAEVKFPYLTRPVDEDFLVKPETYRYLSMQYLLVPADATTIDLTLEAANNAAATTPMKSLTVSNVPVQANYRTNIYGKLLTTAADITVDKQPGFSGEIPVDAEEFDAATIANGGNVVVSKNVETIDIPATLDKPLSLYVTNKVGTITLPASNNKAITVNVAKDVDYPEFVFTHQSEIKDFTLKGDPNSTKLAKGFIFLRSGSGTNPRPRSLENFTLEGVNFDGAGFIPQYSVSTKNTVIRNCKFIDCTQAPVGIQHALGGSDETAENITIEGCTITFAESAPADQNGLYLLDISGDIVVKNNVITGATAHGVQISCGAENNGSIARATNITVTGNTISGNTRDGIKIDNQTAAALIITDNTVTVKENGIRVKNSLDGNTLTVTGNTIDMANNLVFSETDQEPWGILIIKTSGEPATATITGSAADNTFLNSKGHDFVITNINNTTN